MLFPAKQRLVLLLLCAAIAGQLGCTQRTAPQPDKPQDKPAQTALPATVRIQVTRFIDGDSFVATSRDGQSVPVRISGIDTPEKDQPGSRAASNALRRMVTDRWLVLRVVKRDRYGRLVGRLMDNNREDNNRDVGLMLVRKGLAWHFKRYEHEQAPAVRRQYRQAQRDARDNGLGLWSDPTPTPPWEWRRQVRSGRR